MEHILWNCTLAKSARKITLIWLEIDIVSSNNFDLEAMLNHTRSFGLDVGGGICIALMLWSTWLAKNELIFNNVRTNLKTLEYLIKYRSFLRGKANKLILQN